MTRQRIGEWLVERQLVSTVQMQRGLAAAASSRERLGSQLVALGFASEGVVAEALSTTLGVPGVDLSRSAIDLSPLSLIPQQVAEVEQILPIKVIGEDLLLAMADPQNTRVIEEVQLISGMRVLPHVALASALKTVITAAYAAAAEGVAVLVGEALPPNQADELLSFRTPVATTRGGAETTEFEVAVDDDPFAEVLDLGEEIGSVRARPEGRVILVIDDEEEIVTLIALALEKKGYRVEKALRGSEGLAKAAEVMPDLILLDANLPEVHGFDVCAQLKRNPRFAHIPVIIITAVYRGWRFAQDSVEAFGADDFMEKPFRLEELLRRVDHHLTKAIGEPGKDRERADALYQEGLRHLEGGRIPQAVVALDQCVELDAFNAKAHYNLGKALQAVGDTYRALSAYERSVELRPDHFSALRALATLYQQKGFRRKAVETWERAIPAAPDDATRQKIKSGLLAIL